MVERRYVLDAEVCGQIGCEELDPRMLGDHLAYLDNEADSDVLVVYIHGFGGDQEVFRKVLEGSTHRGVAVTLYGFEPSRERRPAVSMETHCTVLRAYLRHIVEAVAPKVTILVGFSSGADLGFRLLTGWPPDRPIPVDGYLSISCNLSLGTCFLSRVLAGQTTPEASEILPGLLKSAGSAADLGEWLNTHEYLVRMLRKFQSDLHVLRRHGQDVIAPFERGGDPFPGWFRETSLSVRALRCVFADTEMERQPVKNLLLAHQASGVLGERYHDDSIRIEPGADHFDLMSPGVVNRYLGEMIGSL